MADKDTRVYTIPLRADWLKQSRNYRAPRAISFIRGFVQKHTHVQNVLLSERLNKEIWAHTVSRPPAKIKVSVKVVDDVAHVKLPFEPDFTKKEEKKGGLKERLLEKAGATPSGPTPKEQKKEAKKAKTEIKKTEEKPNTAPTEKKETAPEEKKEQPKTEKQPETKPA
ncbi:MAG: 60S ribosomal protein L31 [Nanoarchaeota archaeon]|nr:60S ribosomal protein L31 [Nanoarchaeota archaeon]